MTHRSDEPVRYMPASAYIARRRRRSTLRRRIERLSGVRLLDSQLDLLIRLLPAERPSRNYWLLGAGAGCLIAAVVLAVVAR